MAFKFFSFGQFKKDVLSDPTALGLLASNLLTIAMAIMLNWGFFEIFWIYWAQTIILLFFMCLKTLNVKGEGAEFEIASTGQGKGKQAITTKSKWQYALFGFLLFLFINALYLPFVLPIAAQNRIEDFMSLLPAIVAFFAAHLFSFIIYRKEINQKKLNDIWYSTFSKRILPLHFGVGLLVLLGPYIKDLFTLLFLSLKTFLDVWLHVKEHEQHGKHRHNQGDKKPA